MTDTHVPEGDGALDLSAEVARGLAEVGAAADLETLQRVEADLLGRRSVLARHRQRLAALAEDERRREGRANHEARRRLEAAVEARRAALDRQARGAGWEAERLDLTETIVSARRGRPHLLTQAQQQLEDTFVGLGFTVSEGPEVESDWYNFEALNFAPHHPARQMQDTLYVRLGAPESTLLRTHTSPVQVRVLESQPPPIYTVAPGRAYRRDTADASHLPGFHQIEGLVVDRGITFGHLAGTLDAFTAEYFGTEIATRLRPSFFPFTEPSAEFDITCVVCTGAGCRTCAQTGWLELGGCGMVHPNVLVNVGLDPEEWTGFAFGFGIERLAMMRHGVDDIREFVTNDVRFLHQF